MRRRTHEIYIFLEILVVYSGLIKQNDLSSQGENVGFLSLYIKVLRKLGSGGSGCQKCFKL